MSSAGTIGIVVNGVYAGETVMSSTKQKWSSKIWSEPYPSDLEGQKKFYFKHGFLVLKGLLDEEQISAISNDLDRVVESVHSIPSARGGNMLSLLSPAADFEDGANGKPGALRKIDGISKLSAILDSNVVRNKKTLEIISELLDSKLFLFRATCMFKPAHEGSAKPWHQDAPYCPFSPLRMISTFVAIDECSPENGCLQIIPGTHRELHKHFVEDAHLQVDITGMEEQAYFVPLEPGDCLLFDGMVLHGSQENRSAQERRSLICLYLPDGLEYVGPKDTVPEKILVYDR